MSPSEFKGEQRITEDAGGDKTASDTSAVGPDDPLGRAAATSFLNSELWVF
jgi:hypothetical protein